MVRAKSDKQRQALIEAAIRVVARVGRPEATVGMVAEEAGLAAGIVSFYFGGKDALFAAAFNELIEEYDAIVKKHLAASGSDPAERLAAIIAAGFDPAALDRAHVAAWFAFWAYEMSRKPWGDSASRRELKYTRMALAECKRLKGRGKFDAKVVAIGLEALIDGFWWAMRSPRSIDAAEAKAACHAYLAGFYPELLQHSAWRTQKL
jgi:TetR/AcrR family transcriptional repressor of bet genes